MTRVIAQQSTGNMEYVRTLLREKQPGFSATLESALKLLEPPRSPASWRVQQAGGLLNRRAAPAA